MFEKAKVFLNKKTEKMEKAVAPMLAVGAAVGLIPTVSADLTAGDAIKKVVNIVLDIFRYIGIILTLWGIGSLVMAFKNEDADSKSRAIMSLVVGIALITLKTLFGSLIDDLIDEANTTNT